MRLTDQAQTKADQAGRSDNFQATFGESCYARRLVQSGVSTAARYGRKAPTAGTRPSSCDRLSAGLAMAQAGCLSTTW